MNNIKAHTYLVGYAQNGSEQTKKFMKPTAENIANFIMQNDEASIIITDELDLPIITAYQGYVNSCNDRNFMLYELQPAIIPIQRGEKEVGEIDEYQIDAEDTQDLSKTDELQKAKISDTRAREIMESALSYLSDLQKGSELYFTLKECLDMTNEEMEIEGFTLENYYDEAENDEENEL